MELIKMYLELIIMKWHDSICLIKNFLKSPTLGIDYKTRLLNNRVEQYNTKRSYWGEDERQPRTDGINTGLDLHDALPPVINKTIANARYAVKLDGYTPGILKNRIDKANVNMVLVDKENKKFLHLILKIQ